MERGVPIAAAHQPLPTPHTGCSAAQGSLDGAADAQDSAAEQQLARHRSAQQQAAQQGSSRGEGQAHGWHSVWGGGQCVWGGGGERGVLGARRNKRSGAMSRGRGRGD